MEVQADVLNENVWKIAVWSWTIVNASPYNYTFRMCPKKCLPFVTCHQMSHCRLLNFKTSITASVMANELKISMEVSGDKTEAIFDDVFSKNGCRCSVNSRAFGE